MAIKRQLKKILTGITIPQEYVCVDKNKFEGSPAVYLCTADRSRRVDVTDKHLFLGYKPVIMAMCLNDTDVADFLNESTSTLEFYIRDERVACLTLTNRQSMPLNGTTVIFYEAFKGEHVFLNGFHKLLNKVKGALTRSDPGNVSLPGNLYDQVRVAYCVPRIISLFTLQQGDKMNMFPTDLHGAASADYYFSSLRKGSKANEQIEQTRKIVLSDMRSSSFREVYNLGKNHMREPAPAAGFDCSGRSIETGTPLPTAAVAYRELEIETSFDLGIHRIHRYKILRNHKLDNDYTLLAHIHQYFAQWRIDHDIPTNLLFR